MMPHPAPPNDTEIDRIDSGADRQEMGDRLSVGLGPQSIALSPRLLALIERVAKIASRKDLRFRSD
jgi:hypothetical protein